MQSPILFESAYSTSTFVLNRPKALNALNQEMLHLLIPKLKEWDQSDSCKIIIGRGNGPAFCAGGDVKSAIQFAADPSTLSNALNFYQDQFQLYYNLATISKPYVAIMEGITFGGGVGISAYAPYRIATEKTVFAMPEVKIGCFPDVGSTYVFARLDGQVGTYLALTGNSVTGYEVYHLGLATHYIPSRRISSVLERLDALEVLGPHTINETLSEFDTEPGSMLEAESQLSISRGQVRAALDRAFACNDVESIIAELENFVRAEDQSEVQTWARRTLDALALRSPTSLKVTLEALRMAEREDYRLSDALQRDLAINTAFTSGATPDFNTGVTSVLVNKDPANKRPNWSPSTLEEVSRAYVWDTFFSPTSPYVMSAPRIQTERPLPGINLGYYALPSENDVGAFVLENTTHSGVSVEEVVAHFEATTRGKSGVRFKVKEVLARRCETMKDGRLKWI
ncbi:hypothetical protein BS47DRAFT_1414311 [Hydnum rufescens UP504]|uniref:3-hydroxyisobutyryl-CoA hydrolase n=1 Tax=Hydnum rufescens UP504 TaxID=1448309 RepID=A0A9P6AN81_9AGAM|nr:hypothetical protein BS47DRAFT_1414311 [Hydnum rufescens UP504]